MTGTKRATVISPVVLFGSGRLQVTERPGRQRAFVLVHGFLDDPRDLRPSGAAAYPKCVGAFDFMGYGRSTPVLPPKVTASPQGGVRNERRKA